MKAVVGDDSGWLHMLVWIGLFGLIASFHGIIMGYSRQIFALARAGYLPRVLAALSAVSHAAPRASSRAEWSASRPSSATSGSFGGQTLTANIVTMSVFGAIVMYIVAWRACSGCGGASRTLPRRSPRPVSVVSRLRARRGGGLPGAMVCFNGLLAPLFLGLMALGYGYFLTTRLRRGEATAQAAGARRGRRAGLVQ